MTRHDRPVRARRPASTKPPEDADEPQAEFAPPQVVPEELVRSVMLRINHAVRWGNWAMVDRVIQDARRQSREIAHEILCPLEDRPVECLHELAGLPEHLIKPLRLVNRFARRPVTIGEVLAYGSRLSDHEPYLGRRAEYVWAAIRAARRRIERETQALTCWSITC
jgi:hypothetical protein